MVHRPLKNVGSHRTLTHQIAESIHEMRLESPFCHEGVIRASRSDQKSLIDLETHYCGEGIVAAALRPDTIPPPPDSPPDPTIEFLNEQIRRQTRANKKLLWQTEPAEWDFWGDIYRGEETQREEKQHQDSHDEVETSSGLEWHGLGLKGQEILAELYAAKKMLSNGGKSGRRTRRQRFAGGWNGLGVVDTVLEESETNGALYSALADRKARILDAIDRATKSQASSELPYGYPQDHGLRPPYSDWGPLKKIVQEPEHPEFVPPEKEQPLKGQRSGVKLDVARHPWDYLGFNSETAVRRSIKWDTRRRLAIEGPGWKGSFIGGFLLAIAIMGVAVLISRWVNTKKVADERRGRTRVRFDEELALEKKDVSEVKST